MPRIAGSVIEDIKNLNIVDVVAYHIELNRRGNEYVALCPFHSEKTPSFKVNENGGFFKCFGCGKGGDSITFVMEYKSLEYPDAIMYICEVFGIEIKYESEFDTIQIPLQNLKELHAEVAQDGVKLLNSGIGANALKYLLSRGIRKQSIETFELGYMSSTPDVEKYRKKYGEKVLIDSGIFYRTERGLQCHFAERILFPIRSVTGSYIAFSGRTFTNTEAAKYKNSPETAIFSKRKELYNIHAAKEYIKNKGDCYIVEGYFDVIRMWEAGYKNTVAVMGTAFTAQQANILKRYSEEFIMLMDGDTAGQQSMLKSRAVALDADIYPKIIFLPEGDDPDTFIDSNSPEIVSELFATKIDLYEYLIRREFEAGMLQDRKFQRLDDVVKILKQIKNPLRKENYINLCAKVFNVNPSTLTSQAAAGVIKRVAVRKPKVGMTNINEREFIGMLLKAPSETILAIVDDLSPDNFEDEEVRKVYERVVEIMPSCDIMKDLVGDVEFGGIVSALYLESGSTEDIVGDIFRSKAKIVQNHLESVKKELFVKMLNMSENSQKSTAAQEIMEINKKLIELKELLEN